MIEKPKSLYTRLFKLVGKYWFYLLGSTLAAFIYVSFNSISIWLTASLLNSILADFENVVRESKLLESATDLSMNDRLKLWTNNLILQETAVDTLKMLCVYLLSVFAVKNVFLYLKNILLTYVQFQLITELRNRLYVKFQQLSLSYFDRKKSGELTSIVVNDVANMRRALSTSFQKLFVEPINILAFLTLMFIISPKLTLVAGIIVPVSGIAIFAIGRSIRRKSRRTAGKIAGITNIITETLASIRIVKAFSMEQYEITKFLKETKKYFKLIFRRAKLRHLSTPITETIGVGIGVSLLMVGGMDVLVEKSMTSEDFIRFVLLMFSVMDPLRKLSNVNVELQAGMASAERVYTVLDRAPDICDVPNAVQASRFKDRIQFEDVHFHYKGEDTKVLNGISFSVKKGEIVAVVGASGAGKSTIADLIPRFYDVTSGKIMIDGKDIREVALSSLREQMGIVTQETILFNDTIKSNIAYGLESLSEDAIREAAKAANALEFIEEMPDGWNSIVGDKGVRLSGGQRQRLAIARALLKNPPILILDEATSSLDTKSELAVQVAIEKLMKNRTTLVIAHRLSTIKNADIIIVLKNGEISETGSHEELMKNDSVYKNLYDIQFNQ